MESMKEASVITLGQIFPFLSSVDKNRLLRSQKKGDYSKSIFITGDTLGYFDNGLFEIISKGYLFYSRTEDIEVPVKLKNWVSI